MKVSELIEQLQTIEDQGAEIRATTGYEIIPIAGIAYEVEKRRIILCDSESLDVLKGNYNE